MKNSSDLLVLFIFYINLSLFLFHFYSFYLISRHRNKYTSHNNIFPHNFHIWFHWLLSLEPRCKQTRESRCKYIKPRCMSNHFIMCSLLNLAEANRAWMHCTEHNNQHQAKRSGLTQWHFTTFEPWQEYEWALCNKHTLSEGQAKHFCHLCCQSLPQSSMSLGGCQKGGEKVQRKKETKQEFRAAQCSHVYLYRIKSLLWSGLLKMCFSNSKWWLPWELQQ